MNNMKMLYHDVIDVTERIDIKKASASKQVDPCPYWYFLNKGLKFQPCVCNMELAKLKLQSYCKLLI